MVTTSTETRSPPAGNYRAWLQSELVRRCRHNPRYSLRAFASALEMSPSHLSRLINGKKDLTPKIAQRIATRLALSPRDRVRLMKLVLSDQMSGNSTARRSAHSKEDRRELDMIALSQDAFTAVSDWYHGAIFTLVSVQGFRSDPRWIARRLGISPAEAASALERLFRLEVLRELPGGRIEPSKQFVTTTHDVTSAALRVFHRQLLGLAAKALDEIPVAERDITSMTMSVDSKKLPAAKEKITRFRRQLCKFLETGRRDAVFNLGIQLFPLTRDGGPQS